MLDAEFQDNRTSGSKEDSRKGFLPYMGIAAILIMSPGLFI